MKVGFTGTRQGMNDAQYQALASYLDPFAADVVEWHDGDCLGADAQFAKLVNDPAQRVAHPCDLPHWRAYLPADLIHPPLSPLTRNRIIVESVDMMLATPAEMKRDRGSTWFTIAYTQKQRKQLVIIWRDGSVTSLDAEGNIREQGNGQL